MRMLAVSYLPEDCSSLVDNWCGRGGVVGSLLMHRITANTLISLHTAYPSSSQ